MKTHKAPTVRQLQSLCDKFNRDFPPGTPVILRKDSGEVETAVLYEAYVLGWHSAVAHFQGVSGAYSIEDSRVRKAVQA